MQPIKIRDSPRPISSISSRDLTAKIANQGSSVTSLYELKRSRTSMSMRPTSQLLIKNRSDTFITPLENEWSLSNEKFYKRSTRERSLARRLADEVMDVVKVINEETKQRQLINTHRLGLRIASISYWKEELNKEISLMRNKIYDLNNSLANLEKQLESISCPLVVSLRCMDERSKRIGVDAIRDSVEINLNKELDCMRKCQCILKGMIAKTDEQQKLNTLALEACEKDVRNKTQAQELDNEMYHLHDTSDKLDANVRMDSSIPYTISHPISWAKYSYENIQRSQKERENSTKLYNRTEEMIKCCHNELQNQCNAVNVALKVRVQNLTIVRNNLQSHFQQVNAQIQNQIRVTEKLRGAITEKEGPLKVAQMRLQERNKRIDMELCQDSAVICLQTELIAIKEAIIMMKSKLAAVTNSIEKLQKLKAKLEEEIRVKDTSLDIDGRICLSLRKSVQQDRLIYVPTFPMVY